MIKLTAAILICLLFATCFAMPQYTKESSENTEYHGVSLTDFPLEKVPIRGLISHEICAYNVTPSWYGCPGAKIVTSSTNVMKQEVHFNNEKSKSTN